MAARKPARQFEDLEVWQKAHGFVLNVYKATSRFPKSELYGLSSQLRRAAVSIAANISEGFGKRTRPDKSRFYSIAQGSLQECLYYCILAKDLGYLKTNRLRDQINEVGRLLNAYASRVRSA